MCRHTATPNVARRKRGGLNPGSKASARRDQTAFGASQSPVTLLSRSNRQRREKAEERGELLLDVETAPMFLARSAKLR